MALFLALIFGQLAAQSSDASISYMEGTVDVSRNGRYLNSQEIEIGLGIEEFDTIETGPDGYAEVQVNTNAAGSLVKVQPDTSFYFTASESATGRRRTLFQMLKGSLSLKVNRLASRESYEVQTDNAVMAVRGTEFNVDMAADRSILVSVPEGRVETQSGRQKVFAQPGTVATIDSSARIGTVAVEPGDIELYREYWRQLRLDALKINARMSIQQYSRQWDSQIPRLRAAMREIESNSAIFRKWERIMKGELELPPAGDAVRDKMTVSRGMIELRAALPLAERSYYTLTGLEDAYQQGLADGPFSSGNYRDAAHFYREFQKDKVDMKNTLAEIRYYVRIYRFIDSRSGGFSED